MDPVVASDKLKRAEVWAEDDESVHWAGAFAVYGGHGTTASSTIVYEIEPGHRLGWHTDATEETQYIIAGTGDDVLRFFGSVGVPAKPFPRLNLVNHRGRRGCAVAAKHGESASPMN